jgi:hypothetical protein
MDEDALTVKSYDKMPRHSNSKNNGEKFTASFVNTYPKSFFLQGKS